MPCKKCGALLTESNFNVWSNLCIDCELKLRFIQNLSNSFKHLHILVRRKLNQTIEKWEQEKNEFL
jgi:hypothetical protein